MTSHFLVGKAMHFGVNIYCVFRTRLDIALLDTRGHTCGCTDPHNLQYSFPGSLQCNPRVWCTLKPQRYPRDHGIT